MHVLICFEGTSYAGKTTVAKIVSDKMSTIYGPRIASGWEEEEREIHKNPDHLARFAFFVKEIIARSEQVRRILDRTDVVLDRYLLSVFAYHNVIVSRQLESETNLSGVQQPSCTVLLTVGEVALKRRMKSRPPRHQYESDPSFLLDVQHEFLRLVDRDKTIIVDTSIQPAEEIANATLNELVRRGLVRSQSPQRDIEKG